MAETAGDRADAPETHQTSWGWRALYALLVVAPLVVAFFAKEWWQRGALLLLSVITALQMLRAEQKHTGEFKGRCPFCQSPFFQGDRECPRCERTIPRELREPQARI